MNASRTVFELTAYSGDVIIIGGRGSAKQLFNEEWGLFEWTQVGTSVLIIIESNAV